MDAYTGPGRRLAENAKRMTAADGRVVLVAELVRVDVQNLELLVFFFFSESLSLELLLRLEDLQDEGFLDEDLCFGTGYEDALVDLQI